MSLKGKIVVFTGTLATKRADAKKLAEAAGATVTGSVSGKTDILIAGSGAGAKMEEAKSKGVDVWTEEEFLAAVEEKKAPTKRKAPARGKKQQEEEEEEEEPTKKKPKGRATKKTKKEEEEEEEEQPKKKAARKAPPKKASKKEEEEEEEEEQPKKVAKKAASKKASKKDDEEDEKEEVKKPASSGPKKSVGPRVDKLVPNSGAYKVHEDYTVKLNQTNVDGNNNKYYIIQLLTDAGGHFKLWTRWGRVGEPGQNQFLGQPSEAAGIKGFEKKFHDKTKNAWSNRDSFRKVPGKYQLVETEEEEGEGGDGSVPLGKLSKPQIERGQEVLSRIESAIKAGSKAKLNDLSSEFFSLIPTDFGRKRPEPITTMDKLHEKEELLKFYLRMGFEEMEEDKGLTPVDGVMDLPLPKTLHDAAHMVCTAGDITSCDAKGKELAGKQVGAPKVYMDASLYASIMLYTSNAIYAQLNKVLREENRTGVKKFFKYLRLFLEAFNTLPPYATTLWRGVSVDLYDQYVVGTTITWWGVSSCTSDINVAKGFMKGCGGKCTLLTVKAKTACDISKITFYSNEKESLLAPGTQLKVLSSKREGLVSHIEIEEVGRLVS